MNDYTARYQNAPDELLVELASDADGLLPEAREALGAELRARKLTATVLSIDKCDDYAALVPSGSWYDLPLRALLAIVFMGGTAALNGVIAMGVAELPRWVAIAIIPPQLLLVYWIIKKLKN